MTTDELHEPHGRVPIKIIPGSMGARSYIVRGKGNPESFS